MATICVTPLVCCAAELPQPPAGYESLFNGKDLSGWQGRPHTNPVKFRNLDPTERAEHQAKADADFRAHWRVEEGENGGEIVNDGHGVFCTSTEEFGDFELLVDWKMVGAGTDSGIYLRGSPQVQIWDIHDESKHKHGGHLGSGGLWNNNPGTPGKDPLVVADRPVGEWNTFRIRLVGDRATVHLNNKLVVDNAVMHNFWDREKPLYDRGPIQLQTHGGEMRFRNIFLRRIESKDADKSSAIYGKPYSEQIPGTETEFVMLPIPGGEFVMGSPEDEPHRSESEGPTVLVRVEPFWMGEHEVTWEEYQHFMRLCNIFEKFNDKQIRLLNKENQIDAITAPSKLYEPGFTYETGDDPQQPAVSMSQYAAKQYTKWLSLTTGTFYRLPTEAEWEYACRAGTYTAYSFGEDADKLDEHAWHYGNCDEGVTGKVGQKKPNAWGLYDMHGNVAEWVLDQFHEEGYAKFAGKQVAASEMIAWPTELYPRVVRGGSWDSEPEYCRCASRVGSSEEWKSYDPNVPHSPWWFASEEGQTVGFRLVRPQAPPPRDQWNRYWDADVEEITRAVNRRIDKEGRGERGWADPGLPAAAKNL